MAKTQIFENYEAFSRREDKSINGVTTSFKERHDIDLDVDNDNIGCWNCVNCKDCVYCAYCECEDCVECKGCFRNYNRGMGITMYCSEDCARSVKDE